MLSNKCKKNYSLMVGILSASLLVGCTPAIPEGDIKDFVTSFDYETTYENVNYGESIITVEHIENNEVVGNIEIISRFDKEAMYYYIETNLSGNYYGEAEDQYNFHSQKTLVYKNSNDEIISYQLTDGTNDEVSYDEEGLTDLIEEFFYIEVDAGYHQGGSYYGDYVAANCGRYYPRFSLNEEKTILTYEINTVSIDIDNNEIVSMQKFSVNKYGMLLSLLLTTMYVEIPNKVITSIVCDYSGDFERLTSLQ